MICWKCKHDMPDGLKYCGHCGVRMNRVLYALEWLFSRKGLPVLLTLLALIIGGLALWLIPKFTVPAININFDLDMGLYQPSDDDIVYSDDEKSYGYVSNMMLIFFTRDATPEQIGQIVAEINGEVVGIMPGVNQYQVKVTTRTEEELEDLRKQLMTYDVVKNAVIDYVSTVEGESIPNDPWPDPEGWFSNSNWDESAPYGSNWWAEAVKLPSAWEYRDYFTNIKVGITDTGFDTAHEDLSISVLNAHLNNADRHGTHVAGIIGATHNNGLGISGVLENASLYGVDCFATEAQEAQRIALSSMIGGIDLCLNEGCRVVNMSVGLKLEYAQKHPDAVRSVARNTVENLVMMLDYAQEDFIICQSAGNSSLDAYDCNGYFCSIDRAMVQDVLDQMRRDGVKLEKTITVDDVMNCFMIVGAVDYPKDGQTYYMAEYSNFGDSVTICAPGSYVLSTIPNVNNYAYLNGTSMATPVVTGVTALVWSVDPAMSAAQVREILLSTATKPVHPVTSGDYGSYYMIDAKAAVEKAVGVLESKPDPTYYAFWDYENSTSVPTTVSTYQDITGVACARSSYNWEFLSGNYENVVDGYDPNLGVFLYGYDQASLDTYKAYLESIGFSFYLEKEYSQGTSCFYRYGNSYYMDLFVSEDGSQLAVEPFMNADPAGSPEDPTEPPEDPTEPSQDPTTPSDPHPYYRVWDYASQSFVESQISEYSHITGFDCVFSAENWAFLQEGFGNTTAGYDRNLRVFLYQYDWRYFYAYTDHLRLKGWTYRMDETDQGTYYYYEHPEDGFHMDIFIFQDGSYLAVEPYMNKSGSSASAYYLFWDYANQEFAASDVIAYHNFTGAECVFSTSNWKFLEDYTFELVEGYDPTQCIFIHAYDADLLAEYENYLEEAGFTSYLVEDYTQGTSHYYRHAASGFYLDLFVSTDRRSLSVSPFLNADPAADTDPDEPPQDYSWNQCYKFWDYKDQVFVQSAMATYQAVTGSECLYSSPDWSFLHEDYSQVSEGYQDTLGVFLHAYDAASMNAYTAYLESRGFTSYLVEKYAQGTSYYYEHPERGYFVDIFVTKDGSYIVIEPYMNADPA